MPEAVPVLLVVDDEPAVRRAVQRLLESEGWKTVVASGGDEALQFLARTRYDLLLTDLQMPGMDGLELAALVRDRHPETEVILMTSFPTLDTALAGLKDRLYDYLLKPFTPEMLLAVLRRWRRTWELKTAMGAADAVMEEALSGIFAALESLAASLPGGTDRQKALSALGRARELQSLRLTMREACGRGAKPA